MYVLTPWVVVLVGARGVGSSRGARTRLVVRHRQIGFRIADCGFSIVGVAFVIWGFVRYRQDGLVPVWTAPAWEGL